MSKKLFFSGLIIAVLTFNSCSEDKELRCDIVGEWRITEYNIQGAGDVADTTQHKYQEIIFDFDADGDLTQEWSYFYNYIRTDNFFGEWEINDTEMDFDIESYEAFYCQNFNESRREYDIIEISDSRFILQGHCNNDSSNIIIQGERLTE